MRCAACGPHQWLPDSRESCADHPASVQHNGRMRCSNGRGWPLLLILAVSPGVHNHNRQVEFLHEFGGPLFANSRWTDDYKPEATFSPALAKHNAGLNGFLRPTSSVPISLPLIRGIARQTWLLQFGVGSGLPKHQTVTLRVDSPPMNYHLHA